ncbi:MAG: group II intron reverse transcriptase/maturase [Spirochaetota bacterium]
MHRNPENVSTKRQRIAKLARQSPEMGFTSLAYLMDLAWLREAYRLTRKDAAAGVDGQRAAEYEEDLDGNLRSLLDRAKSGRYQAPPVRRVHIPKSGSSSETRPIGIPTLEDKVLQRAVVMLLEPIYEQDFYDVSYGFRPGRSAHQALESLWKQLMGSRGGWILEVDIRKFFDTLDHAHLRAFVKRRVCDGVLNCLIGKWLKAGVMEDGNVSYPEAGSPQGGVISPLAANVYLHYVLDEWFEQIVKPRLKGTAYLVRYADDFVIGFTHEADALRVMEVLPKRFGKYGLAIHPEKTRLVPFRRPRLHWSRQDKNKSGSPPGTFQFLGFTHFWGRSLKGNWVVQRKTASERFRRSLKRISQWCREHRHFPLEEQQQVLSRKLRGHFAYFGITGNSYALSSFRYAVLVIWRMWLSRRNRRRSLNWERFNRLLGRYPLPAAKAIHSVYVAQRNYDPRNRMH